MCWIICLTSPVALSRVAALLTAAAGSQRSVVQTCQAISEQTIGGSMMIPVGIYA